MRCKNILMRCDTKTGPSSGIIKMISKFNLLVEHPVQSIDAVRLAMREAMPLHRTIYMISIG